MFFSWTLQFCLSQSAWLCMLLIGDFLKIFLIHSANNRNNLIDVLNKIKDRLEDVRIYLKYILVTVFACCQCRKIINCFLCCVSVALFNFLNGDQTMKLNWVYYLGCLRRFPAPEKGRLVSPKYREPQVAFLFQAVLLFMSIFLPTAGPVKKYFRFSFLGICARVAWGGGSRPALQIPTLFQTNTYKANVRESSVKTWTLSIINLVTQSALPDPKSMFVHLQRVCLKGQNLKPVCFSGLYFLNYPILKKCREMDSLNIISYFSVAPNTEIRVIHK